MQKTSPAPNQTGSATQTVSFCYDALHRVTGKGYGAQSCPLSTPIVTYAYDSGANAKGKLSSLTDQAGTASYTYDVLERLAAETRTIASVSKSTGYAYNLDGSVKTLTYPSGRVVTYTLDSAGRLVSAVDGNGTQYVGNATYYAGGGEYQIFMPGIYFRSDLNTRLQVSRYYSDNGQVNSFFIDKTYNYGQLHQNNGNVVSITNNKDSSRTQTFTYDALNRITSGWSSANTGTYSWGENYSIDAWGNLQISPMQNKAYGGTFQLSGNAQNRPTGLNYDAAGNLLSYLTASYTYDPENRLSSAAGMTYTYDGKGGRVLKSQLINNVLTPVKRYWSMDGNTLAEGDGTGNLTAEYIYFGSKRIARIDLPANTVHYYLSDHLGSTSIVASTAGTVEEESDYSPFGTEVIVAGHGVNELKFTGKRRDSESQLDYFGARHYGSRFGRFINPDQPFADQEEDDPQSWNLYVYARNNPLRYIDPDGQSHTNSKGFIVGDYDGECINHGTLCWDAKKNEWYDPRPRARGDQGYMIPLVLGPFDIFFFRSSGGAAASAAEKAAAKAAAEAAAKTAAEAAAKAAAEAALKKEVAELVGKAATTIGNQGIRASSRDAAEQAAKEWAGAGARNIVDRQTGQVVGQISADGSKVVRFTSVSKPQPYINLVNKTTGGNLHVAY